MTKKMLKAKKREELVEIAAKLKIPYRTRMRKDDLIEAIQKVQRTAARKATRAAARAKDTAIGKKKPAARKSRKAASSRPAQPKANPKPDSARSGSRRPSAPQAEPRASYIDRGHPLPMAYGQDRLVALVRDPYWLFVYWELSGPQSRGLSDRWGPQRLRNAKWVLRAHNESAGTTTETTILLEAYNWYLNVDEDAKIVVELGCYLEDRYLPVLRSGAVSTPRSRPSDKVDDQWAIVDEKFNKLLAYHRISAYGGPTSQPAGQYSGTLAPER